MFVGHMALALAARTRAPRGSLGLFVAASFGLDLIWPLLLLGGLERVRIEPGATAFSPLSFEWYPWSHSLLMTVVWAAAAALILASFRAERATWGLAAALVMSHWVLDAVSHRPDMPIWPGTSPRVGLGLWDSVAATLVVEGAMLIAGVALYARATRAADRAGAFGFWSLIVLVTVAWAAQPFSPPPASAAAVASVSLALWLLPLWSGWADRHRVPAGSEPPV